MDSNSDSGVWSSHHAPAGLYMPSESTPVATGEPDTARPLSGGSERVGRLPRVLYVWQADYPWDVRVEKIARTLTDGGFVTHIAARNQRRAPTTEVLPEATMHRLAPWGWADDRLDAALQVPLFFNPRWARHLVETMDRVRPQVVLVRDLPLAPTAIWAGRRFGVPVVMDMAENYPAMLEDIWSAGRQQPWDIVLRNARAAATVESYCVRHLDHVVVVVEENAHRVAALGVPPDRITVVSNTPPRARAHGAPLRPARTSDRLEVVYLGILELPRGLQDAINAVRILRARSVPVRLTIIGTGRDEAILHARARDAGLTEAEIGFTGYIPSHDDALRLVAAADVGIVPTRITEQWQTSIPNKLFDYMAAGLPVLTSNTAPCERIVRETGAGEVFRAGDAADLARALLRLRDPEVRRAAGEAGRNAVLGRYNWERDSAVLCRVIDQVLQDAGVTRDGRGNA
jgi:glycosyltransferase involved in cell wall biosynthesis